jgi:PAS domain-containing protein
MSYPLQEIDMWLVDSLMIPATLHDVEGRFVHVNEGAERASEKTNAQWLGRHFTEPLPPEVRESLAERFRRAA